MFVPPKTRIGSTRTKMMNAIASDKSLKSQKLTQLGFKFIFRFLGLCKALLSAD